jgi:hypothetical protein
MPNSKPPYPACWAACIASIRSRPPHAHLRPLEGNAPRLPCVTELFPEILDDAVPDDHRPSCSVRMSLAAQGLFINDVVVRFASHLLYELFSKGRLAQHGVLINLDSKRSGPIEVDPLAWRRFRYEAAGTGESKTVGSHGVAKCLGEGSHSTTRGWGLTARQEDAIVLFVSNC